MKLKNGHKARVHTLIYNHNSYLFSFTTIQEYHSFLLRTPHGCQLAVKHYLDRIKEKGHLNAFSEVYEEESLENARRLDRIRENGEPLKKLHGVVIALKDVICYKDHKVTAASKLLKDFISLYSATVVERLLGQDAIIIGTCNCDEFAMGSTNEHSAHGNVLNKLDETRSPGGSSGGSAVAVQAGMTMLSLGSDTGGSVRQPADHCGVIGFKPSYGTISRHGLIAYASSFDQIGIFGNSIIDIETVLEVIEGQDDFDGTVTTRPRDAGVKEKQKEAKYKIAILRNAIDHPSLDPEIKIALTDLATDLQILGNEVTYIDLDLLEYIVPAYYILTTAEASSNLSRYDGVRFGQVHFTPESTLTNYYTSIRSSGFGAEVKRRIMLGTFVLSTGYYEAYYNKAQKVRRLLIEGTNALFAEYDAIILPSVSATAPKLGDLLHDPVKMYLSDIYTVYANLTGISAISIPLFRHSNGMPFGAQIMANTHNEVTLFRLSESIMVNHPNFKIA